MSVDVSKVERSRRALLLAGLGAAGAALAASVGRAMPVRAADGDPVTVGSTNDGSQVTAFRTDASNALEGTSTSARGVSGVSTSGQGVHGQSSSEAGVAGASDSGNGVHGVSTSSRGIYGQSTSGAGVEGSGAIGVKAESTTGYAIETTAGAVRFAGISGVAEIPAESTTFTVKVPVTVGSTTLVFLTPEANLGNKDLWYTKPGSGDSFVIHLSGKRSKDTRVAWLVIDHA